MAEPLEVCSPNRRQRRTVPARLEKNLAAYALAGAAGLGMAAVPAQGAIHYTKVKATGTPNTTTELDLNADGVSDFSVQDYFENLSFIVSAEVQAYAYGSNKIAIDNAQYAHAFNAGDQIGPTLTFRHSPVIIPMAIAVVSSEGVPFRGGEFINAKNKFLGLQFVVNGQVCYGWARVDVRLIGKQFYTEVVDFAYQDTPNTPIAAGQGIRGGQPGTLGALAVGADGISSWREPQEQ